MVWPSACCIMSTVGKDHVLDQPAVPVAMEGGNLVTHDAAGGPLTQFAIADHRRPVSLHNDHFEVVAKHFNQIINLSDRRQNFGLAAEPVGKRQGLRRAEHAPFDIVVEQIKDRLARAAVVSRV